MVPYSPTNVYVLARLSCLLSHARNSAASEESRSVYSFVAEAISTDVIKPASRLRVARVTVQGDVRTYERIYIVQKSR